MDEQIPSHLIPVLEEYPIQINDKVDCNEKACWVSNIRFTTL